MQVDQQIKKGSTIRVKEGTFTVTKTYSSLHDGIPIWWVQIGNDDSCNDSYTFSFEEIIELDGKPFQND